MRRQIRDTHRSANSPGSAPRRGRPPASCTPKRSRSPNPSTPEAELTGQFVALVSDFNIDRTNERFAPRAWDGALGKIRRTGKPVPILFGHAAGDLHSVLGMVPAEGWRVDERGLWAEGWIDVSEPIGQKIYRMLGNGALQWSVGFTLEQASPGPNGVRVLQRVDELLELSVTPLPANRRTRTVAAKSDREPMTVEQLRDLERGLDLDPEYEKLKRQMREQMLTALGAGIDTDSGSDLEPRSLSSLSHHALREKAERTAREHAPVVVATFEC